MTREQIEYALQLAGADPNDLESIKSKLLIVWMDNGGHYYHTPDDKRRRIVEFNMEKEVFVIEEMNKNFAQMVVTSFDMIQKLVLKSNHEFDTPYQQKW